MAAASPKKKAELTPGHKRNLCKYAKLLHSLGVNVSEHVEKLELDENELKEIRKKIGKGTFIKQKDRADFKFLIKKIYALMSAAVKFEGIIWEQIAPLVFEAYRRKINSTDLIWLRALHEIHKSSFQKKVTRLKAKLPPIRNLVLQSVAKEDETIFQRYPNLLNAVEKLVSELIDIEARYANVIHPAKAEFSELNKLMKKILYDDVYFLARDIAKLYDLRLEIYKWLIEADNVSMPRMLPGAEHEKEQILAISNFYTSNYKEHIKNVSKMHLQAVEK